MKKILLCGIAALLCSVISQANAADFPVKAPRIQTPPPPVAADSWSGFYAGINGGYGWGRAAEQFTDVTSATVAPVTVTGGGAASTNLNGGFGGAQLGYNWQLPAAVVGVETDFQFANQRGALAACDQPGCQPGLVFLATTTNYRMPWFSTFRARIGVTPLPQTLLYVTGGAALGRIETGFQEGGVGLPPMLSTGSSTTRAGWVIGGGLENAFTNHWSAKIEYLYIDYGTVSSTFSGVTGGVLTGGPPFVFMPNNTTTALGTRVTDNLLRAGLNYRF